MVLAFLLPFLSGLFPFLFASSGWTWTEAALVGLGVLALLSLRAVYQLQQDNDVLLGQTPLQKVIADKITEGNQLLLRLRRKRRVEEVPRQLTDQIVSWSGRTIRDLNEIAPDVANDLYEAHKTGLDTRVPKDQMRYVREMLGGLKKIGREIGA
jgi:hypothetical protein